MPEPSKSRKPSRGGGSLTDAKSITPPSQAMRVVIPVDMDGIAIQVIQDDPLAKLGSPKSGQRPHLLDLRIEIQRFKAHFRRRGAQRVLRTSTDCESQGLRSSVLLPELHLYPDRALRHGIRDQVLVSIAIDITSNWTRGIGLRGHGDQQRQ